MPDGNAAEQHATHPEVNPLDLDGAKPQSERGDNAKQKHAQRNVIHTEQYLLSRK
jgi:hypothetical protein